MTDFEKVLQECLHDLEQGASNVEDCLSRHPQYAPQLEPILLTTAYLERAREVRLSDPFRARVRTKLVQQMYAHPRKRAGFNFMFMRLATGFAAIILALLATGTAYAQSAMPGDVFYPWKLASENAWRAVSPDPIGTDLALAERRMDEMIAVSDDPALYAQALSAYVEVSNRLKSEANAENETRILTTLDSQIEELNRAGLTLPQPDEEVLPPLEEPTSIPQLLPTANPLPILNTPRAEPTDLPQIIPTVQAPSEPTAEVPPVEVPPVDLPPVQEPPRIIPTVDLPPLLP